MSMVAPYPHVEIDVEDKSIYIPVNEDILPLHRPLYIMRTQKGPVGVPVWCESYTRAKKIFGSNTFNQRSKYFSPASYFLLQQLQSNGAFIMRAGDDTANSARVFVELGVKAVEAVPQYQRDAYGKFVYDEEGKKIALASATATAGYLHYAIGNHEYHCSKSSIVAQMSHDEARSSIEGIFGRKLSVASRIVNGVNFVAYDNGGRDQRPNRTGEGKPHRQVFALQETSK